MTLQAAVVLFLISMAGNIYQFWGNRKARDLDAIKNELELLQQLQKSKDKAYEEALRVKDLQIKQLTDEVKAQTELIEKNTNELKRMQKMVTFLIGNGCQGAATCADNCPYSLDDLDKILSGNQPQH
jgi:coenzyme F420-reducing hydrogenase gamma subunit